MLKSNKIKSKWIWFTLIVTLLPFVNSLVANKLVRAEAVNDQGSEEIKLFDTELGKGIISYHISDTDIQWTVTLDQKATEKANQFQLELRQNNQPVEIKNLKEKNEADLYTFDTKTDAMIEKSASKIARKSIITFETAQSEQFTIIPKLIEFDETNQSKNLLASQEPINVSIKASSMNTESSAIPSTTSTDETSTTGGTNSLNSESTADDKTVQSSSSTDKVNSDEAPFESAVKSSSETVKAQEITRSAAATNDSAMKDAFGLMINQDSFSDKLKVVVDNPDNLSINQSKLTFDGNKTSNLGGDPAEFQTKIRDMFVQVSGKSGAESVIFKNVNDSNSGTKELNTVLHVAYNNVGSYNAGDEHNVILKNVGALVTIDNIVVKKHNKRYNDAAIQFSNNMYSGVSYNGIQSIRLTVQFYDTSGENAGGIFDNYKGEDSLAPLPIIHFGENSNSYFSFASLNPHTVDGSLSSYEFAGARDSDGKPRDAATVKKNDDVNDDTQIEVKGDLVALNGGGIKDDKFLADASHGTYFGDVENHAGALDSWNGTNPPDGGDKLGLPNFWRTGVAFNLIGTKNTFVLGSTGGEACNTLSSSAFVQVNQTPPNKTVTTTKEAFDNTNWKTGDILDPSDNKNWIDDAGYKDRGNNDLDRYPANIKELTNDSISFLLPQSVRDRKENIGHDPLTESNFSNILSKPSDRFVKGDFYYFINQPMINLVSQSVILPDTITISDQIPTGVSIVQPITVYNLYGKEMDKSLYSMNLDDANNLTVSFTKEGTKILNKQSGASYPGENIDPGNDKTPPNYGGEVSIRILANNDKALPNTNIFNKATSKFTYGTDNDPTKNMNKFSSSNTTTIQKPSTTQVKVTKIWHDNDNKYNTRNPVKLNLERKLVIEDDKNYTPVPDSDGEPLSFTPDKTKPEDAHPFSDLDQVNENGVKYDYRVVEEGNSADYTAEVQQTSEENGYTFVWSNTLNKIPISLEKVDLNGNPIEGITFSIFKKDQSDHDQPIVKDITKSDGTIQFSTPLSIGEYRISETLPTDKSSKYIKMKDAIFKIEADKDGNGLSVSSVDSPDGNLTLDKPTGDITFKAVNKEKVPLPATGGTGMWRYELIGVLALITVGSYFIYRRTRKEVA